eukprot:TRINITY_DN11638_c0_g2_i1.p1 TRINITY_DN11638_c0_g2~~TRINITY_DN11638_c0_g2_i1.p1  ORF type:complete len:1231 (+),score=379.58 TRINITY_DN11638_c0_g2_i1:97-3693(+)
MSVLLVLCTGVLAALLTIHAYERLLDDQAAVYDAQTARSFALGADNVRRLVAQQMDLSLACTSTAILEHMEPARAMCRQALHLIGATPEEKLNKWETHRDYIRPALYSMYKDASVLSERNSLGSLYFTHLGGNPYGGAEGYLTGKRDTGPMYYTVYEPLYTLRRPPEDFHTLWAVENDGTHPDWWLTDGVWRDRPTTAVSCDDTLALQPACTFGGVCDCAALVCGSVMDFGGRSLNVTQYCQRTCNACTGASGASEAVCLPFGTVNDQGGVLLPPANATAEQRECELGRAAELNQTVSLGDCCLPAKSISWTFWVKSNSAVMTNAGNRSIGKTFWYGPSVASPLLTYMHAVSFPTSAYDDPVFGPRMGSLLVGVGVVGLSSFVSPASQQLLPEGFVLYVVTREAVQQINGLTRTDFLVAASAGDVINATVEASVTSPGRLELLHCTHSTDPTISASAEYLLSLGELRPGGYGSREGFDTIDPQETGVWEHNGVGYFQKVKPLGVEDGLDWRMILLVPREPVLGEVDRALAAAQSTIQSERERLDEDRDEGVLTMALVVAGCGVLLIALSAAANLSVARHISRLEAAMARVATMDVNDGVDIGSGGGCELAEVASMTSSFAAMVSSLREYRSYLPLAILARIDGEGEEEVDPPAGSMTIVFTDIVGSSKLWECNPEAMNEALEKHNDVVRRRLRAARGYEVKTIGDSFMIAFARAVDAVNFAVTVHEALVDTKWPKCTAMERVHDKWAEKKDSKGDLIWHGVTIRVGAHCGDTVSETNPITGRTDYRGGVVNAAARLEGLCPHGGVMVSNAVRQLCLGDSSLRADVVWSTKKTVELRGIGSMDAHTVYPARLTQRVGAACGSGRRTSTASEGSSTGSVAVMSTRHSARSRMGSSNGGVAVVLHTGAPEDVDHFLKTISMCMTGAARTEGGVTSVLGVSVQVAWNVSVPTSSWQLAPTAFAALIDPDTHVGCAAGPLMHGDVGGSRQRFYAVVGFTGRCASSLAQLATSRGMHCLCTFVPKPPVFLLCALRPVDSWGVRAGRTSRSSLMMCNRTLTIEEPNLRAVLELRKADAESALSTADVDFSWSAEYRRLFFNVVQRGCATSLETIRSKMKAEDAVLAGVVQQLDKHIRAHPSGAQAVSDAPAWAFLSSDACVEDAWEGKPRVSVSIRSSVDAAADEKQQRSIAQSAVERRRTQLES